MTGRERQQEAMRRQWADPDWRAATSARLRRTRKRISAGDGNIYIARVVGTNAVKIGFALYPPARIGNLGAKYRRNFVMLKWTPGTHKDELRLHAALREHRHPRFPGCHEFYPRSILSHPAIPAELRSAT